MANYNTSFSCLLDLGLAENLARALEIREEIDEKMEEEEGSSIGFVCEAQAADGPGVLWISTDETGDPEHVISFVQRCAEEFGLSGRWGFQWANTCSSPRLDAFGGGACVIDLKTGEVMEVDTNAWLAKGLDGKIALIEAA